MADRLTTRFGDCAIGAGRVRPRDTGQDRVGQVRAIQVHASQVRAIQVRNRANEGPTSEYPPDRK